MSAVLNAGVMNSNPVGNKIRSLENQLENSRKDFQLLLSAIETKSPELFAEFGRMKEEIADRAELAQRASQQQQSPINVRFVPTEKVRKGRF
jgi:hypothetical protein